MAFFQKWIYGGIDPDEEQKQSDLADAKLRVINEKALARGAITQDMYDQTSNNISTGTIDAQGEINTAFKEGIEEGIENIKGTVESVVTLPFKFISWKVWIVGGAVLFVWMGGLTFMKGKLK